MNVINFYCCSSYDKLTFISFLYYLCQLEVNWKIINFLFFLFKLHVRERSLDDALLQSGKFNDALESVLTWLKETEEMVANQKAPSADYKVVKAQLQEQKVRIKVAGGI